MIDVVSNMKAVEMLKSELLTCVASLFSSIIAENNTSDGYDDVVGNIANIIIHAYLLGRRLGADYGKIDSLIHNKLQENIKNNHDFEKKFHDLTALLKEFECGLAE